MSPTPEVLQKSFRSAMGNVAAAVSVVTVLHDGAPHGTTVSAFSSLSMTPPLLILSLDTGSTLLSRLQVGVSVGVNVLADDQAAVALRFASKGTDKFDGTPWDLEDGAPALTRRHAWVAVTVERLIRAGDHVVVIGQVENAGASDTKPLTYWQSSFGTHTTGTA